MSSSMLPLVCVASDDGVAILDDSQYAVCAAASDRPSVRVCNDGGNSNNKNAVARQTSYTHTHTNPSMHTHTQPNARHTWRLFRSSLERPSYSASFALATMASHQSSSSLHTHGQASQSANARCRQWDHGWPGCMRACVKCVFVCACRVK